MCAFSNSSLSPENSDLWWSCVKGNRSWMIIKVVKEKKKKSRTISIGQKRPQYKTGLNSKYKKENKDLKANSRVEGLVEEKLLRK